MSEIDREVPHDSNVIDLQAWRQKHLSQLPKYSTGVLSLNQVALASYNYTQVLRELLDGSSP